MSHATRTLADTARDVATTVDFGVAVGLPEPQTISISTHGAPRLIFRTFEGVEAWANHYGITARTDTLNGNEFIEAALNGARLTSNRPITED